MVAFRVRERRGGVLGFRDMEWFREGGMVMMG